MALNTYKYGIIICMFVLKSVILFSGVGNSHHNMVKNYEEFKKNITRLVNLRVQLIHLRVAIF